MGRRTTETLRRGDLRHYSLDAARERGFDVPASAKLTPKDGATSAPLTIPPESADAVIKALHWVAELPDLVRLLYLDKVLRRSQTETARRLGLSKGRLSQALASLGARDPALYLIVTGKRWEGPRKAQNAHAEAVPVQLELGL